MSHHKNEETIICPNCGFAATNNYCAQCGQETHLHKETFIGLVVHFVAHYFHYDSKFWVTLKTLLLKPGKLSKEYWEKKRNRYIPPISLYIFVSAVFFLIYFSTVGSHKAITQEFKDFSINNPIKNDTVSHVKIEAIPNGKTLTTSEIKLAKILYDPAYAPRFLEGLSRNFPKLFFFMIPLMAFTMKLLYARRKEAYFVDHAVFSIHFHAFSFIALFITLFQLPAKGRNWFHNSISFIDQLIPLAIVAYLIVAMHNAYRSGWLRSIINALVILLVYGFAIIVIMVIYTGITIFNDAGLM